MSTQKKITPDMERAYLVSEYNGHMYPAKAFDWEEHRAEQAIRHANVLDAIAGEEDISGSFGWCMTDYNTHKDFGSGDRICYHGVMDMFRNPKLAADIYACQQEERPVLSVSSTMDIGEHPGGAEGKSGFLPMQTASVCIKIKGSLKNTTGRILLILIYFTDRF